VLKRVSCERYAMNDEKRRCIIVIVVVMCL